jgi:hypothetical protein
VFAATGWLKAMGRGITVAWPLRTLQRGLLTGVPPCRRGCVPVYESPGAVLLCGCHARGGWRAVPAMCVPVCMEVGRADREAARRWLCEAADINPTRKDQHKPPALAGGMHRCMKSFVACVGCCGVVMWRALRAITRSSSLQHCSNRCCRRLWEHCACGWLVGRSSQRLPLWGMLAARECGVCCLWWYTRGPWSPEPCFCCSGTIPGWSAGAVGRVTGCHPVDWLTCTC